MHPASYLFLKSECNVLQVNRCSTKAKFLDKTLLSTDTHTHQKKKKKKKNEERVVLTHLSARARLQQTESPRPKSEDAASQCDANGGKSILSGEGARESNSTKVTLHKL